MVGGPGRLCVLVGNAGAKRGEGEEEEEAGGDVSSVLVPGCLACFIPDTWNGESSEYCRAERG